MNRPWEATIPLDAALAQHLIAQQFPALGATEIGALGVGWDNAAYLLTGPGGQTVFRFPRRQLAVDLLLREARILPLLAPHLPLPIPAPRFLGTPTADFPYPFVLLLDYPLHLTGIIDWGDVHLGDPALDLSLACSFLPPEAHAAFRAAYGPIDDATWRRARFRAIHYGALLAEYGHATASPTLARLGSEALQLALTHP